MRTLLAGAAVVSLALTGCMGPGDPVEIPADTIAAATTCFAAQGLKLRAGKDEGAPVTYDEFVGTIKYPLVAAAQVEPFSPDTVAKVLAGATQVADEIATKDYEGAIAACDARFKIDDAIALPQSDSEATLACLSMASFMQGAVQAQGGDFGAKGPVINDLKSRLEAKMQSDPEILAKLAGGADVTSVLMGAMKGAFAEGAPGKYVESCAARFPAS